MSLRRTLTGLLLAGAVLLFSGSAAARVDKPIEPHAAGWEAHFKIDWEVGERKGRPVLRGYLHNTSPHTILGVQLLVDTLDTAGNVVAQSVSWVGGGVPAFGRVYFDVPAPQPGAQYRVRVYSYDRFESDGQRLRF